MGEGGATVPVRELVRQGLSSYLTDSFHDTRAVDVLVATNRAAVPGAEGSAHFRCSDAGFGVLPAPQMSWGSCRVNLPRNRAVGAIESTSNPRADTHRYLRVLQSQGIASEEAWLSEVRKRSSRGLLVFIHGFNVKFEEAVLRAAQIAYDLKFQGGVVLLTWPAGPASSGFLESTRLSKTYETNRTSAQASVEVFASSFKRILELGVPVYVTVHSMGHQVALPALAKALPAGLGEGAARPIEELFLNAPDFPVEGFQAILPELRKLAKRITVYCSYQDNAIAASEVVNQNRRLGACERFDGVDVINVGEVDSPALGIGGLGHGYYASRAILTDIFQAILGVEADRRLFIRASEPNTPENFYLRP